MPQRMKKNQKQNVPRKAQNMRKPDQRQKLAAEFNSMYRPMLTSSEPRKRSNGTVQLSKCALKYALAIASPFNVAARGACIPTVPAPESFKTTGFIRGTAFIGTAGVGYILVAPCLAKDMPALFCTNALYTGTSTLILSARGFRHGFNSKHQHCFHHYSGQPEQSWRRPGHFHAAPVFRPAYQQR
jgi:hypothetical protein